MNPFMRKNPMGPSHPPEPRKDEPRSGPDPVSGPDAPGDVDETAALIDQLQAEVERLTREREEAVALHKHALADFQNFQRRSLANERQACEQGVRGVLTGVMSIIDNFDIALGQDPSKTSAKQIIDGVTMIREELLRVLAAQGVGLIRPEPDATFDPARHEAIMHQAAPGITPGHVVATLRLGYTINDRVVRPAQVSVAPP